MLLHWIACQDSRMVQGAAGGAGAVDQREGGPGPGLRPDGRPGRPDRPGASSRSYRSCDQSSNPVISHKLGHSGGYLTKSGGCDSSPHGAHLTRLTLFEVANSANARLDGPLHRWKTDQSRVARRHHAFQEAGLKAVGCTSSDEKAGWAGPRG